MPRSFYFIKVMILVLGFALSTFAQKPPIIEEPLEKEKLDFGEAIKESTGEVKKAESKYSKEVNTKKYVPRRSKNKEKVRLNIPKETIQATDNLQWDHNKKAALKQKSKLDSINTLKDNSKK